MTFKVAANFTVKFINPDDVDGDGMRVVRGRVEGSLDASSVSEAAVRVSNAIEARFPVRWSLRIGKVSVQPC